MSPVNRSGEARGVAAILPLRPSIGGSAGSFLVAADDGCRYWCKALNNLQSPRVPVTEQIVALGLDTTGLDRDELHRLADRLEHLSKPQIEAEVSRVPAGWPVGERELQAVADFADTRRQSVAERLRGLLP